MKPINLLYLLSILAGTLFLSCNDSKTGCTDPNAFNFDPTAETNDGSCSYPENEKKVLMILFNNSQNSTCGSFGIPLFNNALSVNSSKVIPMVVHPTSTDTLFSGSAVNIASVYNQTGYPDIAAGLQSNLLTLNNINQAVDESYSITPIANSSASFTIQGDSIIVTLYAKFFGGAIGEYYAAAYILENNINLPQAGITDPTFRHNYVLRATTSTSAFGDLIANSGISSATSFKKRYGIYKPAHWNVSNLQIISAIWKQEGTNFTFINVND